jgi:hypothetical protein
MIATTAALSAPRRGRSKKSTAPPPTTRSENSPASPATTPVRLHGDARRANDLAKLFRSLGYSARVEPYCEGFTDLKVIVWRQQRQGRLVVSRRGIEGFPAEAPLFPSLLI